MTMTPAEIAADYRQAKTPLKQIGILADLNQCSRKEIVDILREQGCELPKFYAKKESTQAQESKHVEGIVDSSTLFANTVVRAAALNTIEKMLMGDTTGFSDSALLDRIRGILQLVREVEHNG